jgi:hypothetical protein
MPEACDYLHASSDPITNGPGGVPGTAEQGWPAARQNFYKVMSVEMVLTKLLPLVCPSFLIGGPDSSLF